MTSRQRMHNRIWLTRLVIAALLFQVLAYGWHVPLMAMSTQLAAGPGSAIIVICSPSGSRLIAVDQNGNPIELPEETSNPPICSICLSLNATAFITPPVQIIAAFERLATTVTYHDGRDVVTDRKPFVRCGLDPPLGLSETETSLNVARHRCRRPSA